MEEEEQKNGMVGLVFRATSMSPPIHGRRVQDITPKRVPPGKEFTYRPIDGN